MKTGILIDSFRLPIPECLEKAAALGVDGVQLYAVGKNHNLLNCTAAELNQLRRRADDLDLEISALCAELGGHGCRNAADNPAKITATRRIMEIASLLGSSVITTHIGVIPEEPDSPIRRTMVGALNELAATAAQLGVSIGIETGPESAETLLAFLNEIDGPVGANFDPANLLMVRNEDPVEAIEILHGRIVYAHFKDGVHYQRCDPVRVYTAFAEGGFEQLQTETGKLFEETPPGRGGVDFRGCLKAFRKTGYDFYFTVEREGGSSPEREIADAVNYLKQLLREETLS